MADFVKSAGTRVTVEETQGHIISVLHRYGASGFGFRRVGDTVSVTFHIPGADGRERTIEIPIDIERVRAKMNPKLSSLRTARARHKPPRVKDQSERVAWRIVLDWIDAALSAVSIGAQTLDEAFYAHTIIETMDGQRGRLVDYVNTIAAFDPNAAGKLPSPGGRLEDTRRVAAGSTDKGG